MSPEHRPRPEASRTRLLVAVAAAVGALVGAGAWLEHALRSTFPPGW